VHASGCAAEIGYLGRGGGKNVAILWDQGGAMTSMWQIRAFHRQRAASTRSLSTSLSRPNDLDVGSTVSHALIIIMIKTNNTHYSY